MAEPSTAEPNGSVMLTLAALQEIQSECMADDIAIDLEKMRHWDAEGVRRYFESRGSQVPGSTTADSNQTPVASPPLARTSIHVPEWRVGSKGDNYTTYHVVTRTAAGGQFDVWVRWSIVKQLIAELAKQRDAVQAADEAKKRWHAAWAPPWAAQDPAFLEVRRKALEEMLQAIAAEACLDSVANASVSRGRFSSHVCASSPRPPTI